jgi:hypothetical protein
VYEWSVKDKFNKVPPEIFEHRKSICLACPNWDSEAFNGWENANYVDALWQNCICQVLFAQTSHQDGKRIVVS